MGSTLNVNVNSLSNNTIPQLGKAKATLSDCRSAIASISVPSDFPEGGRIRAASGKIGNIISLLTSAESSVSSSVSQINKAQAMNDSIINQLFEPILGSINFSTKKKNSKTKKTTNKNEVTSILGIKVYQPGENSIDKNLVGNLSGIGSQMGSSKKFTKTLSSNLLNLFLAFNNANTKTNATMANGIVSIIKGAGNVGENLLDAVYTGTTWLASQMKVSDPKAKEYMQQNTMSFVAEEYVNNVFYDFYNKNDIGKELDKFAYEPFKSTGVASNLIEGLAYEGTMAVIATATGGGAAALAAVAGAAGFGRETQNSWAEYRNNANGKEWRTTENYNKGMVIGLLNGAWEAVTHGVAAKAIETKVPQTENALLNSAARVAYETVENALDTPVRAGIDAGINNKNFSKAFEEQGGWAKVAADTVLGLVGGTIGEAVEWKKNKATANANKIVNELDKNNALDSLSKHEKKLLREALAERGENPDTSKLTKNEIRDLVNKKLIEEHNHGIKSIDKPKEDRQTDFEFDVKHIGEGTPLFGKACSINSLDDIPSKYLERIKSDNKMRKHVSEVVIGEAGERISKRSEIASLFEDSDEIYFGHGTRLNNDSITELILGDGLQVTYPDALSSAGFGTTLRGLESTTVFFGSGTKSLFETKKQLLDHWDHKQAGNIVIVSLPKKYLLPLSQYSDPDISYRTFYTGSSEQGFYLRPEFIRGIYNAETQSFTPNVNFYKNLPQPLQDKVLSDIRQNYIDNYVRVEGISPKNSSYSLPLNDEEIEQAEYEWYKAQYIKLNQAKYNRKKSELIERDRKKKEAKWIEENIKSANLATDENSILADSSLYRPNPFSRRQW